MSESRPEQVSPLNLAELSRRVKEKYADSYGYINEVRFDLVMAQVAEWQRIFSDGVKGKKILDVGCGSLRGLDAVITGNKRQFEPWFCRFLKEAGGIPVGIDLGNLEGEEFEHYSNVNVLKRSSYDRFADNSFDGIQMSLLFHDNSPSPSLLLQTERDERIEGKHLLLREATRILKEGHILRIEGTEYLKKMGDKLVSLNTYT